MGAITAQRAAGDVAMRPKQAENAIKIGINLTAKFEKLCRNTAHDSPVSVPRNSKLPT